ncbi:hypothetical protein BAUCODRAFT_141107 [Baudoinia panamericana UAMH 10762]|uniref:Metallo-beta-lactamase domain-containing protein n=1 Tax=Baudoinia panamericana (strain UAMH 10762) TaxID=717646 RepID=M2N7R4_BAUPA|nr:uncharacterized protein BAUCODRAFT_141107 [Baudoinia panamericana UAMH 10762]EMC94845.1 hypothetical protein BAUCODRAFT_141107 [Baudoinia panamericana UAMH 10762]
MPRPRLVVFFATLIHIHILQLSVPGLVTVNNELDPISASQNAAVEQGGGLKDIGIFRGDSVDGGRGVCKRELRMDRICCSAHGLSLLITGIKGDKRHTILLDTGPEEMIFELNAKRLRAEVGNIEVVQLSHWHRDHSGGMLRVLQMANAAKQHNFPISVDLHPNRPDYRGIMAMAPISMEADPSFAEIEHAGGRAAKSDKAHTVLDDMFLVSGEIPRVTSYELGLKRGIRFVAEKDEWEEDTLMQDERFLMCKLKDKGVVLFTGCSHAGVVNASRHAVELGKGTPLYAVMGGFHLADGEPDTIAHTVADLKALDPKVLLTGHCTGWRAKFELEKAMPGRLVPSFVGCMFKL